MSDFEFLHDPYSHQWVISAPHRSQRPGKETGITEKICPFDPGNEGEDVEVFRLPHQSAKDGWEIRVVNNKYPFTNIHEVIVHSPDHTKNFDKLPFDQVKKVFHVFRMRYNAHKEKGSVVIFHNFGPASGASLIHPHTQLAVIPAEVDLTIPLIPFPEKEYETTEHFTIFCPSASQWPDEVWIAPRPPSSATSGADGRAKESIGTFGDASDEELADLSFVMQRLIQILDMRHGNNFSFNFYISPWRNWYIRIIPRLKVPGGFELATGVFVNTQDPKETIAFIKEHFKNPNIEKIKSQHQALYHRGV